MRLSELLVLQVEREIEEFLLAVFDLRNILLVGSFFHLLTERIILH